MSNTARSIPRTIGPTRRRLGEYRFGRVALVLLLVVPTLLSAVYMWILWDPSTYLDRIPVAVASDDQGITTGDGAENLGTAILDDLTSDGQLQFHRVSSTEAVEGLRQSRYTFSVVIPAGFTAAIQSVTDPEPSPGRIMVYHNDFNGVLGSTIADMVLLRAQQQISASIGKEYAQQVLVGLNSLGTGLGEASTGASQLTAGTAELAAGAGELATGLGSAVAGAAELTAGTGQLRTGAHQLATGTTELLAGTDELGAGAVQLRDGVGQITTPILDALGTADRFATELTPLLDSLANPDGTLTGPAARVKELLDQFRGTNPAGLTAQLTELHQGTQEIARQLTEPDADYRAGVLALADGSAQLSAGTIELDNGMSELATGLGQLATGSDQIRDGTRQLDDGARQLDTGLRTGSAEAPHIQNVDASADMFSQPVLLDVHNQEPAQLVVDGDRTNKKLAAGSGPLLVLLTAFLAAVVVWMLVSPAAPTRRDAEWRESAVALLRRTWIGISCGVVAAVLAGVFGATVGWSPQSWPAMLVLIGVVGAAAAIISQLFVTAFGTVAGSITAFSCFMFQIFVFGGVYPAGTIPVLFRPFEPIAPMTYARRMILRGDIGLYDHMFWTSTAVLTAMAALAFAAAVYLHRRRTAAVADDSALVPSAG
ncbi:YhgE/Pip family protein [Nocardia sp. SSK8]|uniref:YhgE/Pip family protein n=1 Tax=Nocardia sp. SSK8 TaxID=3120154 RepID=UPI0030094B50